MDSPLSFTTHFPPPQAIVFHHHFPLSIVLSLPLLPLFIPIQNPHVSGHQSILFHHHLCLSSTTPNTISHLPPPPSSSNFESKLSKLSMKILQVLILGQFVIEKVMEATQALVGLSGSYSGYAFQSINHIAHLSGALIGVFLVWLLTIVPFEPQDQEALNLHGKRDKLS